MKSSARLRVCLVLLVGSLSGPAAWAQPQDPRTVVFTPPASSSAESKSPPKRYWADYKGNAIRRANLDGSSVETVAAEVEGPYGISQDPETGSLLWTSSERAVVQSAPPGMGEKVLTLVSSFEEPFALTFTEGERDYAYGVQEGQVLRVTRDRHTGVEQRDVLLQLSSPDEVHGLALSPDRTVLYLGDSGGRMTQRLNLSTLKRAPLSYSDPVATAEPAPKATATPASPEKSR